MQKALLFAAILASVSVIGCDDDTNSSGSIDSSTDRTLERRDAAPGTVDDRTNATGSTPRSMPGNENGVGTGAGSATDTGTDATGTGGTSGSNATGGANTGGTSPSGSTGPDSTGAGGTGTSGTGSPGSNP